MESRAGRQVLLPEPLLRRMYEQNKCSTSKMATLLNCSQDTICRRLKEFGINTRQRRHKLPKEEILELYLDKHMSIKEIALIYRCSHTTISNRLREWGITAHRKGCQKAAHKPTVRTGEYDQTIMAAYRSGNSAAFIAESLGVSRWVILERLRMRGVPIRYSHKKIHLNTSELQYLYQKQKMSTVEIATIYNVKPCTVATRLRELGVHLRGNRIKVDTKEILQQYNQGVSIVKIAENLGCSYTAVKSRLNAVGRYQKRTRLSLVADEIIKAYTKEEKTLQELSEKYGCCPNTIAKVLKDHNISRRHRGQRMCS